ncbi:FtsX-like permease family protein [Zafaria sp. Z1313]|uniref:FtsX-like permease family protein n=1 Tax=unclassified Zafaria TaxID=2828765 RepID=UPI002E794F7E|nr:FtsX-like permease family protein [Zafaria sp. J156]MEE1620775.1 FtsX-like permease family protein [Zafaria sp. J156]
MLGLALANLRTHARRFIAVVLAVMIGTAFLSATLMVNASTTASLERSVGEAYQPAGLVAGTEPGVPDAGQLGPAQLDAVQALDGVAAASPLFRGFGRLQAGDGEHNAVVLPLADDAALRGTVLATGDWPGDDGSVLLDERSAGRLGVGVGDRLVLSGADPDGTPFSLDVAVAGLSVPSSDPFVSGFPQLTAAPAVAERLLGGDTVYQALLMRLDAGADPVGVAAAAAKALGDSGIAAPIVQTPAERTTQDLAGFTGGQDQLTIVLLVFALVALVVTGLVVMNTFAVLVAQRTRELALLRTLGAVKQQIRRSVLVEALLVGLVASGLGVLLAIGVMAGLVAYVGTLPEASFAVLAVPAGAVLAGLGVGTLMTLTAAWLPARRAMRVAPLAALRPAEEATAGNRAGRFRIVAGTVLLLGGGALLALGAAAAQLLVGFAGGLVSFTGLLLLASVFLPPAVRLCGLVGGRGVPARLASLNAVRNPARTSTTATALLIGVTLVAMMMVGAQTTKATLEAELGSEYLVDLTVYDSGPVDGAAPGTHTGYTAADAAALEGIDGVASAALLVPVAHGPTGTPVYAADEAALAAVVNDPAMVPGPGEIVVPQHVEESTVTVEPLSGAVSGPLATLTTRANYLDPLVTSGTAAGWTAGLGAAELAAQGMTPLLWLKADPGLDAAALTELAAAVSAQLGVPDYAVSGGALERAMFTQVIDTLLLVVSGLLAVAVFIALIGVANTLSLSVLERTRESSLLRALGLTRGQLRGMLALEAVLIAGVAAVLGAALGAGYGILGAQSAIGSFASIHVSVPWAQLALVLAVAVLAALAASVVPGRRAARLSPVEGLATE